MCVYKINQWINYKKLLVVKKHRGQMYSLWLSFMYFSTSLLLDFETNFTLKGFFLCIESYSYIVQQQALMVKVMRCNYSCTL